MVSHSLKTVLLALVVTTAAHCFEIYDREEIKKTFSSPIIQRIFVDNISGSIKIVGKPVKEIRMVAKRTIGAESSEKIVEAKEDVVLEFVEERDRLEIVVNAPGRNGENINWRGKEFYGYEVRYDFELEVPLDLILFVKTVNDGKINIENVRGKFNVKNVNGPVIATGLTTGGSIHTVNGAIEAEFVESPKEPCSFKTVNGEIEAIFPKNLAGLVKLKTFNGKAYSDFEFKEISPEPASYETKRGRRIYRRGENTRVQIGTGGPEMRFETLNGNINILQQK
ncbi:MAG: hypothetical protein HYV29_05800 [Ignavibacteriales bacterium]|nr:hypothetical protein [Ignavibacteriales bacterium]